jgi:hypothetical protein
MLPRVDCSKFERSHDSRGLRRTMKRYSLAVAALSTTLGLFAFSCSDTTHNPSDAQAGAGGEETAGATSGSGGSPAHAGSSTVAGAGGVAEPLGGAAGAAGSGAAGANDAGGGGVPSHAGAAGDAGSAGDGGATNEAFGACQVGCATNTDCVTDEADPRFCDTDSSQCVECTVDAHCIAFASGLARVVCTQDDDCSALFDEVCVDVAGLGRCAAPPDPQDGCFIGTPTNMTRFGSVPAQTVEVCARDVGKCVAQRCIVSCSDVEDFCTGESPGYGDVCDAASGLCTCSSDDQCDHGPEHCNPLTHQCDECETAADCQGAANGQECVQGRCGCSSVNQCPATGFPAGTSLCQ